VILHVLPNEPPLWKQFVGITSPRGAANFLSTHGWTGGLSIGREVPASVILRHVPRIRRLAEIAEAGDHEEFLAAVPNGVISRMNHTIIDFQGSRLPVFIIPTMVQFMHEEIYRGIGADRPSAEEPFRCAYCGEIRVRGGRRGGFIRRRDAKYVSDNCRQLAYLARKAGERRASKPST
jgi:hypothetical protein